ncbi:MAG: hypothetical protein F6K42_02875 [Leptolyngbya sp. SIO1D8]|nr:hypothetical protein [Leptolyngbya sp. SIO1D8]
MTIMLSWQRFEPHHYLQITTPYYMDACHQAATQELREQMLSVGIFVA